MLQPLKSLQVAFALLLAAVLPTSTSASEPGHQAAKADRLAVLFHADWCGSCKTLDPLLKAARSQLPDDTGILFVAFDLTNQGSTNQAAMLAEVLSITPIYSEFGPKTGFVLIIDAESKEVLQTITKSETEESILAAFRQMSS
ncbi:MAG: thioredoxin domain-containing protein [Puniceicoccaceae bacterium]